MPPSILRTRRCIAWRSFREFWLSLIPNVHAVKMNGLAHLGERCGALLFGVEQDGDFAILLDGDGEVGSVVAGDEVAGGDAVSALVFYGVRYGDGGAEGAVSFAVEKVRVIDAGGTGYIQFTVQIEISHRAGLRSGRALASAWRVDRRLAEGAVALIEQDDHARREVSDDQVVPHVVAQVGNLHIDHLTASGVVGHRLEEFPRAVIQEDSH